MSVPDPVTDLVARLERAVVAPRRRRRELVAEVEGDLREAVAARIADGAPDRTAASAVVAEFGDPVPIGAELSRELLTDVGRRFSPVSAVLVGVLFVAWAAGMTTIAALPGFRVPIDVAWMLPVSRALDVVVPLVAVAAAVGAVAIRRAGSMPALVAVASLQLALAVALVALTLVLGTAMGVGAGALLLRFAAVRVSAATPSRAPARG